MADKELADFLPSEKLEKEMTLSLQAPGTTMQTLKLSAIGATLYASRINMLVHVRNQFNKLLEDRVRKSKVPGGRVKSIERRRELQIVFGTISAAELKKAVKALRILEGCNVMSKSELVEMLVDRYAPKRKLKRTAAQMAAAVAEEAEEEEEEEEEEGGGS